MAYQSKVPMGWIKNTFIFIPPLRLGVYPSSKVVARRLFLARGFLDEMNPVIVVYMPHDIFYRITQIAHYMPSLTACLWDSKGFKSGNYDFFLSPTPLNFQQSSIPNLKSEFKFDTLAMVCLPFPKKKHNLKVLPITVLILWV